MDFKSQLRAAQVYVPWLQNTRFTVESFLRRALKKPHEPDFAVLATLQLGSGVFVDVGANRGQSIEAMRMFWPSRDVVAFEPNRELAKRIRTEPGVEVRPIGLGSQAGSFELKLPRYRNYVFDGLASIDEAEARDWLRSNLPNYSDSHLAIERMIVEVATLDSQDLEPAFIKIDVQGLEAEVVAGGMRTIESHRPAIMIENGSASQAVEDLLEPFGYRRTGVVAGRIAEVGGLNSLFVTAEHIAGE